MEGKRNTQKHRIPSLPAPPPLTSNIYAKRLPHTTISIFRKVHPKSSPEITSATFIVIPAQIRSAAIGHSVEFASKTMDKNEKQIREKTLSKQRRYPKDGQYDPQI